MKPPCEGDLIRLSAAIAARNKVATTEAMQATLSSCHGVQVEEALLQTYLFLGFPVCLNAFALWRRVSRRPPDPPRPVDVVEWEERGREVCSRVYSDHFERLRESIRGLHEDMDQWMVMEGYGKILGREGLDLDVRELCVVAILAVSRQPKQLYSHLRGALNVGASEERIRVALAAADLHLDEEGARLAWRTWDKVLDRRAGNGRATGEARV
jgi:4-carboxymuconolactone decarboxylase